MNIRGKKYTYWNLIALFACLWLTTGISMAQTDAEIRRYRNAVRLVQQGDYAKAKTELAPLTERQNGSIAPFAHYYYALADFKSGKFTESRLMVKQLMDRFPDWKKMNDAYYLLAASYMEGGQYEEGIAYLARINDPAMKQDVNRLEGSYLPRVTDLTRLKAIQKEYPNDRTLALALIDLIQRTSTAPADLALSDRLTNRFGVPPISAATTRPVSVSTNTGTVVATKAERNRNKGYYNVAVLFPFRVNELNPAEAARSNQYALDLYNGMKLAKTKLQSEGITVNLFAYDIDNDSSKINTLIRNPAFVQNDLVFGPLYAEPNRIATTFTAQNGMALVNPISTSSELVQNQPLAFLAMPSLNQQAIKAATFGRDVSAVKKAAVYFGSSRKDSTLAVLYRKELKRMGFQVLEFRKCVGEPEQQVRLTETSQPGHIFLASSDQTMGAKLLRTLNQRRINVPVIATSSAFNLEKNSLSTFLKDDLFLLDADFVDTQRPEVTEFEEQYLAQRNIIPSTYAFEGYDMLLFFGRMLARNGGQLTNRSGLKASPEEGYLLSGYDYTGSNENEVVPIVHFDGTRFVQVNK